jgi:hypothetical protein
MKGRKHVQDQTQWNQDDGKDYASVDFVSSQQLPPVPLSQQGKQEPRALSRKGKSKMSRTLSGKTTGEAARIEQADFSDSIAPPVVLSKVGQALVLKDIKEGLLHNAGEYPQYAKELLKKADDIQLEIDNLPIDVPAGWLEGDPEHDPDAMLAIEYAEDYAERRDLHVMGNGG